MQGAPVILHFSEIMGARARMLGELLSVLEEVGSEHALIGGLAAGHHGRPRATIDVDLLVPQSKVARIQAALGKRGYVVRKKRDVVRVFEAGGEGEPIADLVPREAHAVLRAAAKATEPAAVLGHRVNVVKRGAFVALKFHAASSVARGVADRLMDVADIGRVIEKRFTADDARLAHDIATLISPTAAKELDKLVDDLRHGRPVTI